MRSKSTRFVRYMLGSIATFFVLASAVVAGPPLICHPFDIGNAQIAAVDQPRLESHRRRELRHT